LNGFGDAGEQAVDADGDADAATTAMRRTLATHTIMRKRTSTMRKKDEREEPPSASEATAPRRALHKRLCMTRHSMSTCTCTCHMHMHMHMHIT